MGKEADAELIRTLKSQGMSERDAILVSMKRDKKKKDKKADNSPMCCPTPCDAPEYPWGLSITLESESLDKLGMDDLPRVGSTVKIVAETRVESVSSRSTSEDDENRSVQLQIVKLAVK